MRTYSASRNQIIAAFASAVILTALSGMTDAASSSPAMAMSPGTFHGGSGHAAGGAGQGFGASAHTGGTASGGSVARHPNFGVGRRAWGYRPRGDYDAYYYPDEGPYVEADGGGYGMPPGPPPCPNPFAPAAMFLNCGGPYDAPEFWPVRPPIGAVTPILPDGAAYEYVNGVSYYTRGGAYYRPRVTRDGILFEVVRTPS